MAIISAWDRCPKLGVFVLLREPEAPPLRRRLPGCHLPKLGVFAQLLESESHAPLHSAERQAQALGYLRVRQLGEVAEREDLALLVGDLPEGLAQQIPVEVAPGLREDLARLRPRSLGFGLLLRPPAGRLRAQPVYALVADHGEHPGAYAASLCPVAARRAPDLQEDLLRQVLGVLLVAGQPAGERVGRTGVAVVEGAEGEGVACPH